MPSRLTKARPTHSKHMPGFSIHQDGNDSDALVSILSPGSAQATTSALPAAPTAHDRSLHRSTLSQASDGAVNAATRSASNAVAYGKPLPDPLTSHPGVIYGINRTIRAVSSFEDREGRVSEDDSTTDGTSFPSASRHSAFLSSVNSNASGMSSVSHREANGGNRSPSTRLKQSPLAGGLDGSTSTFALEASRIAESRPTMERNRVNGDVPQRGSGISASATVTSITGTDHAPDGQSADGGNGWDSTIGKAGLGKTGRVINRLVSDNESLRRDLQIERLRAEESKQTARLLEDKMERMVSEYESRLLEANVTKTLLARKERQVESLQSTVELERKRAVDARVREQTWKAEMEKAQADAKQQVETAGNHAALMEGRYNAISSHWRDQGDEVKKAMGKMKTEIAALLVERRQDDDRIGTLRDLCDQQDGNIRDLRQQKEAIAAQFERYKAEQEQALRDIKIKAQERETEQERLLADTREALDKLRWALNVKDKIEWAQ